MRAKNSPRTIAEVKRLIFAKIKNRTKTKERARSLADKRARKVKEIASLSKCDIATAYATWISLGRPIRRPVLLEELRSKVNLERSNESSPSATQPKLSSCSTPLLSSTQPTLSSCSTPLKDTSLNAQCGSNLSSSTVAPRVLCHTRAVVQLIPSNAKAGIESRDPKPPQISSSVQNCPRTGTQTIPSIVHEGGLNQLGCCGFQAIAADRARTGTSVRSAKNSAAEQPQALRPDNAESLLDWEWDANEGCFQPRQMDSNRPDGFKAFLYEKGKRKRKTPEVMEMERRYDSFHQSKQTRVSPPEQRKTLMGASHQSKQTRVSPPEQRKTLMGASHQSKQSRVSPPEQKKSLVGASHTNQTRASSAEKKSSLVGASFKKIGQPSLIKIMQDKATTSMKTTSLLCSSSQPRPLSCNGLKSLKAKESSNRSPSSKLHGKSTISEPSPNACSGQVSKNNRRENESSSPSAMQSQKEIGFPWLKHNDMRMVETAKRCYGVPTQSREAGVGVKGPVSLRDDTRILLKLKESLDQIEYGPNYDVAAERRAWQRFALAGRQPASESQSGTDEDGDENIPHNTWQPAAQNATCEHHISDLNKKLLPTAAGHRNSQAVRGIRDDADDKISKSNSDHRSKRVTEANAGSSSHQLDMKISRLEDFSIKELKDDVVCVLRSSTKKRMRLSKIVAGVEELAGLGDFAESDAEDSGKEKTRGAELILCILSLLEKECQVVVAKTDSKGAAMAWKLGQAACCE